MIRVYWGGQKDGGLAQAWLAELPPPAMRQLGEGLPRARSRPSWVIGGTHWGIARQLGAARQSKTWHPSSASTGVVVPRSRAAVSAAAARWWSARGARSLGARVREKGVRGSMAGWRGRCLRLSFSERFCDPVKKT